ncbi:MAG: hypothetical protein M1834_002449 [Cirrosporium novae-zelandiae]|nr:MAG: hypothetical protein M1834_002449 [Cirrosporium novae-zelandiae]
MSDLEAASKRKAERKADGTLSVPISVSTGSFSEDADDEAILRAAHRKVDKRLLAWYSFVYLIMRVHATNISNTAIINLEEGDGIKKQLGNLSSEQWAWVLSIFYYPYMFFEPLSTMMIKRFNPNVWMSRIMLTWGIISMCQGATQNYSGILACRFFLGLAEAGYYPGVLYHLSFWYPTHRLPFRVAFFYSCGVFSGTISGLLAYAISFINGAGGLAGWRWVFILEGLPIILCGGYTYFQLPNYPETVKFLSPPERDAILADLPPQAPTMKAKTFNLSQIKLLLRNPTFIPFTMVWVFHGIGGWGITLVIPTVIYELGISDTAISQLMTLVMETTQIICYILLLTLTNPVAKYIILIIATAATSALYPIVWPERIRAAKGTTTAGLAIGFTNAMAQLMGIVGPQIYQPKFGPDYKISYGCSIALLAGATISIVVTWGLVRKGG